MSTRKSQSRTASQGPRPARTLEARCTAVIGLQWGDEGKGKAVDLLSAEHDAVVRFNGGSNAGHSVVVGGERFSLHQVPSGVLNPGCEPVIASGVVVDPLALVEELDLLRSRGVDTSRVRLSDRAHVVTSWHRAEDELREATAGRVLGTNIGTTGRGIGPCYAEKAGRIGAIRVADLLRPDVLRRQLELGRALREPGLRAMAADLGREVSLPTVDQLVESLAGAGRRLQPHVIDTTYHLHEVVSRGGRVLFEGANAVLLDVDHGTFPYTTSSSTGAGGVSAGTGIPERRLARVIGVMKAYSTRVGAGPLLTELSGELADGIRQRGREFGTTTGRPRRVGWLDLVAVRYSAMVTGATELCVTLLDVLAGIDELRVCVAYRVDGSETDRFVPDAHVLSRTEPVYETRRGFAGDLSGARRMADLPEAAREYLEFAERFVGVPITMVGVGPDRAQTITTRR